MDYNLLLPDQNQCQDLKIVRKDIFTKQQCLIYYQSLQYGTLRDFVALTFKGVEIQIVVTDYALFCVKNRILPTSKSDFKGLTDCNFQTFGSTVFMACANTTTTTNRQLFNITISQGIKSCSVSLIPVIIPEALNFQDYNIKLTSSQMIFEVPIGA